MGQTQMVDVEEVLAARSVLYALLQRVFSDVPDGDLAKNESSDVVGQCFDVLHSVYGLRDCRKEYVDKIHLQAPGSATSDALSWTVAGEYNRLFVGVGKPVVCMWESIYSTGVNALFQPATLVVRRFYEAWGFETRDKGKVADDHIAIELAFLRELAILAAREDLSRREELLRAQRSFLSEHLSCWVDVFAGKVIENDRSGYYAGYAKLLAAFVADDSEFLAAFLSNGQASLAD